MERLQFLGKRTENLAQPVMLNMEEPQTIKPEVLVKEVENPEGNLDRLAAETQTLAQEAITSAKALNPDLNIKHQDLIQLLDLTEGFMTNHDKVAGYLVDEARKISQELSDNVDDFVATVGTGYPFYAMKENGETPYIDEFSNFIDYTRGLVREDAKKNPDGWVCASCQASNDLPDLKTKCKPCALVKLRPRDVFKALPDLDLHVIVDAPTQETEKQVEKTLNRLGYTQSDTDIAGSITRSKKIMSGVVNGSNPAPKLPVDVHVWSKQAAEECMGLIASGETNTKILIRSLHTTWEDDYLDFWFDFIFSMSEIDMRDPDFQKKVDKARSAIVNQNVSVDSVVQKVQERSPRAARLLQTQGVKDVLTDRLNSWKGENE